MADKIGARKNGSFKAVSTAPSFNKTPVGPSTPPVPYPVYQDLSSSVGVAPTVNFNGDAAYLLNESTQPMCTGDASGVAGGVKSGTVSGEVKPTSGSSTVNACGSPIVRELDSCTLNSGNCPGVYVSQPAPGGSIAGGQPVSTAPPVVPETANEIQAASEGKGFWGKLWDKTKYEVGEAVKHPWEGTKGAVKGILNIPSNVGEMLLKGSTLESAAEMQNAAAMESVFGQKEQAEQLANAAEEVRQSADDIKVPKLEMSNPAQSGGDTIATVVQLLVTGAGLAKAGVKGIAGLGKAEGALAKATAESEGAIVKTSGEIANPSEELTSIAAEAPVTVEPKQPGAPAQSTNPTPSSQSKAALAEGRSARPAADGMRVAARSGKIRYGSSDLSEQAIQFRRDTALTSGRNVAVFEYNDDGVRRTIVMASERGSGHAERLIAAELEGRGIEPSQVTRIYSELQPCVAPGGYCSQFIEKTFSQAEVTYSFEYGATAASRAEGVQQLKNALRSILP